MESWFWLALASAAIWGATGIIDKLAISRWLRNPWAYTLFFGLCDAVIVAVVFLAFPISAALPTAVLAGVASAAATFLYISALRGEEVSRIVPLQYSSPLFIAVIAAVFLKESLNLVDYAGLLLIVGGAAALTIRKIAGHIRILPAAILVMIASLIYAISAVLIKYTTGSAGWLSVFAWLYVGASLTYIFGSVRHVRARTLIRCFANCGRAKTAGLFLAQAGAVFAYLLLIAAFAQGPASLVAALNTVAPAFMLLYAIVLLRWHPGILEEKFTPVAIALKAGAIAAMIAGVYLIS